MYSLEQLNGLLDKKDDDKIKRQDSGLNALQNFFSLGDGLKIISKSLMELDLARFKNKTYRSCMLELMKLLD